MEPEKPPTQEAHLLQLFSDHEVSDQNQGLLMKYFRANDEDGFFGSKILSKGALRALWSDLQKFKDILITRDPIGKGPHKGVVAAVMGGCGCGKTALINILCNTNFPSGQKYGSYTDQITYAKVVGNIDGKFGVFDTPGTDSTTKISIHANLILASLTYKPLNAIFVITKWRERGMHVVQDMRLQIGCLGEESKRVVFLVSMVDKAEGSPDGMIKEIIEGMDNYGMKQQVVFYSNIRCDRQKLIETLFDIASHYPNTPVKIDEMEFFRNFRVPALDKKHAQDQQKIIREMKDITEASLDCAKQINDTNDKDKDIIIGELGVYLRLNLQRKVEEFRQLANEMMAEHEYYRSYFQLQKTLLNCNERFTNYTRPVISQELENKRDKPILDLIKACPNCQRIWQKIEACPITTCGARPTNTSDWSRLSNFNYQIVRGETGKVTITKKELGLNQSMHGEGSHIDIYKKYQQRVKKLQMEAQLIQAKLELSKGTKGAPDTPQDKRLLEIDELIFQQTILMQEEEAEQLYGKKIGCGYKMNFDELPRIPGIEKKLQEWYAVDDINDIDIMTMSSKKIQEKEKSVKLSVMENLSKLDEKTQNASVFFEDS